MSRQYDRYERSRRASPAAPQRSLFGHWIPLIITVTVATIGIAAWVWSERQDDDEEEDDSRRRRPGGPSDTVPPPEYRNLQPGETAYGTTTRPAEETSYVGRMSGVLKRTPSPQQIYDGASRTVAAGMTTAGALVGTAGGLVGTALSSIREEDKNAYKDHKTWSEEAESRKPGDSPKDGTRQASQKPASPPQRAAPAQTYGKRKTVAVVVSADANDDGFDDGDDYLHEHASILSYLPRNIDFSKVRLFVLIYSPNLKNHPLDVSGSKPPGSLSSSFSNIGYDQAQGEERQYQLSPATPAFNTLWSESLAIVEKDNMIMPFTTPTGHVHILRHLAPDCVYLQESLAGNNGDVVTHLQTWLRQDVVLVVGADGGHGGLADSESEAEPTAKTEQWWEREDRVGRGRGVVVVEGLRVGDDWARRIQGKE